MRSPTRGAAVISLLVATAAPANDPAPDFTLYDTYGQPVTMKGYRGAVLWLTFGATW